MPRITHLHTSHSSAAIAEAVDWMRAVLNPPQKYWIPSGEQIWQLKEWLTLVAMLTCFASLLPLTLLLLRTQFFRSLQGPANRTYACTGRNYLKPAALNGVLMLLYFPLIFVLFGVHVYLIQIDTVFPLMMTNGIVWWFLWINVIGFLFFRRWFKKENRATGLTLYELGLSYKKEGFAIEGNQMLKTVLLAGILFLFTYLLEHTLESIFLVDFRFIFPFASDLTAFRAGLWLTYFPLLLVGFLLMSIFLHCQMRRPFRPTWRKTFISWSTSNCLVLIIPLAVILLVQYIPLFVTGSAPFIGPGGMLIAFTHNLLHIIAVLIMVIPLSTWLYQLSGKIYLGAMLVAAIVTWMFVSSQVIAPIPI